MKIKRKFLPFSEEFCHLHTLEYIWFLDYFKITLRRMNRVLVRLIFSLCPSQSVVKASFNATSNLEILALTLSTFFLQTGQWRSKDRLLMLLHTSYRNLLRFVFVLHNVTWGLAAWFCNFFPAHVLTLVDGMLFLWLFRS